MLVDAEVAINGTRAAIWAAISNIEHSPEFISGIEKIEIVERPVSGLVGLRWRETRILFDKPATVEKWITDAVENESYSTRAESDGFVFLSTMRIAAGSGGCTLISAHDSIPQSFVARFLKGPMVYFFRGVIRKALLQDLNDIKAAIERG
jgi:hypothetical protein